MKSGNFRRDFPTHVEENSHSFQTKKPNDRSVGGNRNLVLSTNAGHYVDFLATHEHFVTKSEKMKILRGNGLEEALSSYGNSM